MKVNYRPPYPNELYHYGVVGMKWGVRRYQNPDGSYTNAGKERYSNKREASYEGYYEQQKAVSAVLTAVGYVPVVGLAANAISLGARAVRSINANHVQKKVDQVDKTDLDIPKKDHDSTAEQDATSVNPARGKAGGTSNCMYCTAAYDMRRRGYDVCAELSKKGHTTSEMEKWYPGAKAVKIESGNAYDPKHLLDFSHKKKNSEETANVLADLGDGARGHLSVHFESGVFQGNHSIAFENRNGKTYIIDGQAGQSWDSVDAYSKAAGGIAQRGALFTDYVRLDNVQPDMNAIKETLKLR